MITQFPKRQYFILATSSSTELGGFTLPSDGDLSQVATKIFHKTNTTFSYTLTLQIAATVGGTALASSDAITFSTATASQSAGTCWFGNVNFTFDEYKLFSGETYYARLVTTGYTRTGQDIYLGINCDWLDPVNGNNSAAARICWCANDI